MNRPHILAAALVFSLGATMSACAQSVAPAAATPEAQSQPANASPVAALPEVLVHKDPNCGCCNHWIEHLREAGFQVRVSDEVDMGAVKQRVGVPFGKGSCHTAEVGGYFVEGHVPAEDIKRLLAQKPEAKGLTVPGMPLGSPGMEVPDGTVQPYTVELVQQDGSTVPFSRHGAPAK